MTDPRIKRYFERMGSIYFGLIALPLLLYPIVYLPLKDGLLYTSFPRSSLDGILYCVVAMLLFVLIFVSRRLYKRNLENINKDWTFEQKLAAYQRISVIFYLAGFISSLCSVGLLYFTEHQLFVAVYPMLLMLISLYRPTIQRLKRELPLSEKELTMFKNKGQKAKDIG